MKYRVFTTFSVAALIGVAFISFTSRVSSNQRELSQTSAIVGNAAAGTSVVWLVLDEAPLSVLLKTDGTINAQRFPGFAKLAATSTWYRNMLGTAQRTTEAVPALLDGKWPTIRNYPFLSDHPINLFTLANGYKKLDVYQSITNLCPPGVCPNKIPDEQRQAEFQIRAFQNLLQRSTTSTEEIVHFSHILLPHRPWRLSTEGRLGKELETDPRPGTVPDRRRDAYQSLLRQFVATDALLFTYLTQLEQSDNWNRTMIVVTADHGITFVPGESYRDKVNPNNPGTLEDIYRVPLFIKYPNQSSASVSDCPVSSIDILPTVLSVARIPHSAQLDGVDLSTTCPQRASRRVRWPYTGKDLTTDFNAVLDRVRYYDKWVDADGSVDDIHRVGISGSLLGTRVPTDNAPQRTDIQWTNVDPNSFLGIGDKTLSYVPARVSGRISTTEKLCSRCEGVLVVDGVIVASIPELAGLAPSSKPAYFTTSVLTSRVKSTSGQPELWIADWSNQQVALSRIGHSK
ncbi:MAG: sulfatase-like hydrolase/transferase [Ilumatobacteraceae bacterium]